MKSNLLKVRRELWIEAMSGQDKHSINNQILTLIWNISSFRVINETRRFALPTKDGRVRVNGLLHHLLNDTFFESTLIRIRKLIDAYDLKSSQHNKKNNIRDVYSIVSLLNDMKEYSKYMTRENFFLAENIEYDEMKMKEYEREYENQRLAIGVNYYFIPQEYDSSICRNRHKAIDTLCNVTEKCRTKDDCVSPEIFKQLIKKLNNNCKHVKAIVDKQIAHSSTPESEANRPLTVQSILDIVKVVISIAKVANFAQNYILNKGITHYRFDYTGLELYDYLDKPLIEKKNIEDLQNKWKKCQKEFSKADILFENGIPSINNFIDRL